MKKLLSVLAIGLVAGTLSISAFAAKPVSATTALTTKVEGNKSASATKDAGLQDSVKKLFASKR